METKKYKRGRTTFDVQEIATGELQEFLSKNENYFPVYIDWKNQQALLSDQRERIEKEKNKFGFKCRSCSKGDKVTWVYLLECDYDKYEAGGALVQDCFSYLNREQRETVKTGMCRDCQRKIPPPIIIVTQTVDTNSKEHMLMKSPG